MELTRAERRERVKSFHAHIAYRASLVIAKPILVRFIQNVPFGQPKLLPKPERNIEPDYWHMMWFHDLVYGRSRSTSMPTKVEDVLRAVAREFGVSKLDLICSRRTLNVVRPRQVAMYLCKKITGRSLPEIGRRIGGRDHTTVIAAIRRIEGLLPTDSVLAGKVAVLFAELGGSA